MKKRVGKIKRFIAMLMVGITLSSSVFYSYSIPAQATTVVPAAQTVIEALMTLFGYSLGFGKSSDGMSAVLTPEVFSSAIDSSFNGGGIELGSYGTVDFSDETAVFEFLKKAYQLTTATAAGEAYDKLLSSYDYVSYKTSGVSSTKTMNNYLGDVVSKYETDGTSALKEDMQQAFTVISGGASSGGDDEDPDFTPLAWRIAAALMAGFTAFGALPLLDDGTEDEAAIVVPADSEYVEYDLNALTFDELEVFNFSPSYSAGVISSKLDEYYNCASMPHYFFQHINSSGTVECKILATELDLACCFVKQDDQFYRFYYGPSSRGRIYYQLNYFGAYVSMSYYDLSGYRYELIPSDTVFYTNLPVLSSLDDLSSFCSGDVIEPLESFTTKVDVFYENVPTSTVPEYVVNFMSRTPSTTDLTGLAAALIDLSTDTAGTVEYIPAVESVVQTATDALPEVSVNPDETPEESVEQEQDPETGQFNYFNILQLILNAIKAIPSQIWGFFFSPITAVVNGVQRIIEIFPEQMDLVRGWIELLPDSIFLLFESPLLNIQKTLADLNPSESWWPKLQPYLDKFLDLFQATVPDSDVSDSDASGSDTSDSDDSAPDNSSGGSSGNGSHSLDLLDLLNALWLLILIIIVLLKIFIHLLTFIVCIFRIPASTGFLSNDMVLGLNYIKSLEIAGIGMSVYDFMMSLVYILILFSVVKLLRSYIENFRFPRIWKG